MAHFLKKSLQILAQGGKMFSLKSWPNLTLIWHGISELGWNARQLSQPQEGKYETYEVAFIHPEGGLVYLRHRRTCIFDPILFSFLLVKTSLWQVRPH